MSVKIRKANGQLEEFDPQKLKNSLKRSGASNSEAEAVYKLVAPYIKNKVSTNYIYSLSHKFLRNINRRSFFLYSLKKAMLKLGPAGYTFEQYFADLMKAYGFKTETNLTLKGKCIRHEIDVLGTKHNLVVSVECKYHSNAQRASDAKVALYVHSRFKDLENVLKKRYLKPNYEGWLVTNTRLTIDAINYASCMNFKAISWNYPQEYSLKKMIEDKKLYPVTILSGIKARLSDKLIKNNIILIKDIIPIDTKTLMSMLDITQKKAELIKQHSESLYSLKTE